MACNLFTVEHNSSPHALRTYKNLKKKKKRNECILYLVFQTCFKGQRISPTLYVHVIFCFA